MSKENEKHFGLRVDGTTLAKFRYVCSYVGRSVNSTCDTYGECAYDGELDRWAFDSEKPFPQ